MIRIKNSNGDEIFASHEKSITKAIEEAYSNKIDLTDADLNYQILDKPDVPFSYLAQAQLKESSLIPNDSQLDPSILYASQEVYDSQIDGLPIYVLLDGHNLFLKSYEDDRQEGDILLDGKWYLPKKLSPDEEPIQAIINDIKGDAYYLDLGYELHDLVEDYGISALEVLEIAKPEHKGQVKIWASHFTHSDSYSLLEDCFIKDESYNDVVFDNYNAAQEWIDEKSSSVYMLHSGEATRPLYTIIAIDEELTHSQDPEPNLEP